MSYATYCRLNLHVGQSDMEVVKAAQRKLKWPVAFKGKSRSARKAFYKEMLKHHHAEQALFRYYRF